MDPIIILVGLGGLAVAIWLSIKIVREPFWGLLAVIFFLPFERMPTLEIGQFTAKINHLVGALLILFWLLALPFNRRKIRPNSTAIPIILFVLALITSLTQSQLLTRSLIFLGLDLFVILIYLATIQLVDSPTKLARINRVLIVSSWVVVIFGFYQFFGDLIGLPTGLDPGYTKAIFGFPRIQAFSKEPLYLGNYLLIPLSVGLAQYLSESRTRLAGRQVEHQESRGYQPRWSLALLISLLIIFILTLSRGAYLGLIASLMIFILFYHKQLFTVRNLTIIGLTGGLVLMVIDGLFSQLGQESKEKFLSHITIQDLGQSESTEGRLMAYGGAVEAWQERPIFGIGLGNYGLYSAQYDSDRPQVNDIVNNQYLELIAETGLVGFGAFVLLVLVIGLGFFQALTKVDHQLKPWFVGLFAAFVGTLVQYNFFSTLSIIHIWVLFGLLVAVEQLAIQSSKLKIQNSR